MKRNNAERKIDVSEESLIQWNVNKIPPKETYVLIRFWSDGIPVSGWAYVDEEGRYCNCEGQNAYFLKDAIDAWAYMPYDCPKWWETILPLL